MGVLIMTHTTRKHYIVKFDQIKICVIFSFKNRLSTPNWQSQKRMSVNITEFEGYIDRSWGILREIMDIKRQKITLYCILYIYLSAMLIFPDRIMINVFIICGSAKWISIGATSTFSFTFLSSSLCIYFLLLLKIDCKHCFYYFHFHFRL